MTKTWRWVGAFGITMAMATMVAGAVEASEISLPDLEKQLETVGVEGEIHASVAEQGITVFTYRNPGDFFDFIHFSLIPSDPLLPLFKTLTRHDRVRVKGRIADNPSAQKHIEASAVEIIKKYQSSVPTREPYEYQAKVPDDLLGKDSAVFLVHAVHADGLVLVVEYQDVVLPVYVEKNDWTKNLYRNDVIRIAYQVAHHPHSPVHLKLNINAPQPVEVLESIKTKHGQMTTMEGPLVLFPKSPQVQFNVFAIHENTGFGLHRQYTVVNFTDPTLFKQIRDKLQSAWDKLPNDYVNGRNKLIHSKIRVRAKGKLNVVDPGQANAQILVDSVEDLQIL